MWTICARMQQSDCGPDHIKRFDVIRWTLLLALAVMTVYLGRWFVRAANALVDLNERLS